MIPAGVQVDLFGNAVTASGGAVAPVVAKLGANQFRADGGYTVAEVRCQVLREERLIEAPKMGRADFAADFWRDVVARAPWFEDEKECFVVLYLDRKNRVKGWNCVSIGTQTAALCHAREVFRGAIVGNATGILCMHNHPSGDPAPSQPDLMVTRLLKEASRTVDIELVDHVVVGRASADPTGRGYFSFREGGLL